MRFLLILEQQQKKSPRNREQCVYSLFVHLMLREAVLETVTSLTYFQRMVSLCRCLNVENPALLYVAVDTFYSEINATPPVVGRCPFHFRV